MLSNKFHKWHFPNNPWKFCVEEKERLSLFLEEGAAVFSFILLGAHDSSYTSIYNMVVCCSQPVK